MRARCINPNSTEYKRYGARGIGMCEEWLLNKHSFFRWAIENGWVKGMQIDRIDNELGYCPENCRIVTPKVNSRNRPNTRMIEYKGETKSIAEWCEVLNLPYRAIRGRFDQSKKNINYIFETPIRKITKTIKNA
jgi:hypothetical protein